MVGCFNLLSANFAIFFCKICKLICPKRVDILGVFRAKKRPLSIECLFIVKIASKVRHNLGIGTSIFRKILTNGFFFD